MTKSACELSFKNGIHLSYSDNHNNFDDDDNNNNNNNNGHSFTPNLCDNL